MLAKTYTPQDIEDKWYQYWMDHKFFAAKPNPEKEPYTVVIPPPNVTGMLHMGHMLNNTIQDVLVRKARMEGKEALWVPGTDHASIATETKVVQMLKAQGIEKSQLSRADFLSHAFEWKEKYGGIILKQLRKLGASCDWDRTRFTMDDNYYKSVIDSFVILYDKGLIYRGVRMVNWDPEGKTAVSDEEVITKEIQQRLVYINYALKNLPGQFVTIATVRPETIMADAAICVNPSDERYQHLIGQMAIIPLINREIPIIADEYVTVDFGTGCLKVTPAHDANDYALGIKHNLPVIDLLNDDGTLNEKAQIFVGMDRFTARKAIIKKLEEDGFIAKIEEYKSNVGTSERTGAVIEPKLSLQWFMKMEEISKPALAAVENDEVVLHPAKFKNLYRHWMLNVRDWCISRQLWWGHQIPAYYLPDGRVIVARSKREALRKAQHELLLFALTEQDLSQDPDVLDTWASSWLWPFGVFDAQQNMDNEDFKYFYPTHDLVTAPEILFFWVARMIIAGYEFTGQKPFTNVYLTGIVRDKQGRKMSKQLGNSPDPIDLIASHGADAVRTGMLFSSPAGNDLLYDEKLIDQGRNFANKIWNAFRLVKGWEVIDGQANELAVSWFKSKLNQSVNEILDHYAKFRISDALLANYNLVWDDFCSKYLEMIKPVFGSPIDRYTYEATIDYFENLMRLTHPFMPFITEEIWQNINDRTEGQTICNQPFPIQSEVDLQILDQVEYALEVVSQVRNFRNTQQLSPKVELEVAIKTSQAERLSNTAALIKKLSNISEIKTDGLADNFAKILVKADELQVLFQSNMDKDEELTRLKEELKYTEGFLASVDQKLANERFVANAKADLVEKERQKKADAEVKISQLKASISLLG